jgi:hypothetical protein
MSNPEFKAPVNTVDSATQYKANIDASIAANGNDVVNLGCSLSAGTFTIHGGDSAGTALASTNAAFVRFQDPDNFGRTKYISVEANQAFIDDAGASEIINNLFGMTTTVATDNDVIFYIYAVSNDAMTSVAFMLSRTPDLDLSPAVGNIGAPDDAVADAEGDFFSFDSLDETLYDTNPCTMVGSIKMSMSSSDDWTVTALTASDGIGKIQRTAQFPYNPTVEGSSTNPTVAYTVQAGNYTIKDGVVQIMVTIDPSSYSGGSGNLQVQGLPFAASVDSILSAHANNTNVNASTLGYHAEIGSTTTFAIFREMFDTIASGTASVGDMTASSTLQFSGSYFS